MKKPFILPPVPDVSKVQSIKAMQSARLAKSKAPVSLKKMSWDEEEKKDDRS